MEKLFSSFDIENAKEVTQTIDKRSVKGKFIKQNYKYLDAAQLTKHLMGTLQKEKQTDVTLVYLWYDKLGEEGAEHRCEIEGFKKILSDAKIKFKHRSYQEIILRLCKRLDYKKHKAYIDYLTERYL